MAKEESQEDKRLRNLEQVHEVICVLSKKIRTTASYWQVISETKHADLAGQLDKVLLTLSQADEVRQNTENRKIFLYYRKINKHWICVVARHLNHEGFIITCYLTSKPKRKGKKIWPKTIKK